MRTLNIQARYRTAQRLGACVAVFALLISAVVAQEQRPKEEPGFLESIAGWLDRNVGSAFQGAGKQVETFGHEAGVAAKTTVNTAKDAAGAVARIPAARVMSGAMLGAIGSSGGGASTWISGTEPPSGVKDCSVRRWLSRPLQVIGPGP